MRQGKAEAKAKKEAKKLLAKAKKEAERKARERAKREAEEAKEAKKAEAKARKEAEREVKERAKREAEEAKEAKKAEAKTKKEAEPHIEPEIYGENIRLVISPSAGFEQVAQFKEQMEGVESVSIVMTGGSADEGSIIVISVQKSLELVHILGEMPMVEDVHAKGKTITVMLRAPSIKEENKLV